MIWIESLNVYLYKLFYFNCSGVGSAVLQKFLNFWIFTYKCRLFPQSKYHVFFGNFNPFEIVFKHESNSTITNLWLLVHLSVYLFQSNTPKQLKAIIPTSFIIHPPSFIILHHHSSSFILHHHSSSFIINPSFRNF